ncbi:hypothetical protein [Arhodomonas sp. AD133]|uniref:hypothetical protein n=1 Tax=Arhodomonas sp. AD133 TaxID=3415009 RepID=UPI003EB807F3
MSEETKRIAVRVETRAYYHVHVDIPAHLLAEIEAQDFVYRAEFWTSLGEELTDSDRYWLNEEVDDVTVHEVGADETSNWASMSAEDWASHKARTDCKFGRE